MKHYFLSRYLPRNFSYKGFLGNRIRKTFDRGAILDKGSILLLQDKGSILNGGSIFGRELSFNRGSPLDFKSLLVPGIVASLCVSLGGCSTTSETFDCKEGKGVGCKSISEVNQMVDQGALGDGALGAGSSVSIMPLPAPVISAGPLEGKILQISEGGDSQQGGNLPQGVDPRLVDGVHVYRISEEHLRVWMAPFQDDQGNLHEGSVIHTVLKPGYWRLAGS